MKFSGLILSALLLWGISGCGGNPQEGGGPSPKPPVPKPASPPAQSPLSLPKPGGPALSPEPAERPFNPEGTPDPFKPPLEQVTADTKSKSKGDALPLEQFEVNDYQLVGIISGAGIRRAVIQDLTGKGFFVTVGTRIGKGGGRIVKITEKEVLVEEPIQDFMGRKKNRKVSLKIPNPL
jgi:Tfp pilus assembly protein PilP